MEIDIGSAGNLERYNPYPIELADEVAHNDTRDTIGYVILGNAWTAEKPCADGFYWMRCRASMSVHETIIRIVGGQATFFGSEHAVLVDNFNLDDKWSFSGPVRPPE